MKKLFLLMAAGGFFLNASAQSANGTLVKKDRVSVERSNEIQLQGKTFRTPSSDRLKNANKTTAGGSRWYNYVEHLGLLDNGIFANQYLPYMWFRPDMYGIYGNASGGVELDTIRYASYGFTLDALDSARQNFNDISYAGELAIVNEPYVLDSVSVYGIYGRNPSKTGIVDTLRLSFVYGNGGTSNMRQYYFTGMSADFGYDTVRFYGIEHDTDLNIAAQSATTNPTVLIKDIILTAASVNDTDASGFNKFSAAVNMNVPSRNLVGMTVTFKSGETYTPFSDTVFVGSLSTEPFKFGMFRPLTFEQRDGNFPTYAPGDWNVGHVKFLPESAGWSGLYVPTVAYTAPFQYEYHYIDFKLSCPTCNLVSVKEVPNNVTVAEAYPNPAGDMINIPFTTVASANVKVNITNAVGATIATQDLGKYNANQSGKATFNVANYANGVYFYTVEANGQRVTKRFVVTR